jgi:peptide/nickel transport system substrate-binding protein
VTEFKANDVISMEANPFYRDPNKPSFATLTFKGGGDAAAAARSVLETGEFDYAWNLQIDPAILTQMAGAGKGNVVSAFGTGVERLMVNLSNPDPALGDARSTLAGGAHPFLTDAAVRRALSVAIDRNLLSEVGYGAAGTATCNVLPAPAIYASTANDECLVQDIAKANAILDEAGWARGSDGIRAKDGVRLSILYQTSTNAVRQDTQALIKQWWSEIGVETELKNIDAAVFFGGDQSSPDTYQKFYADIEMYTNLFNGTDPESYMNNWTCGEIPEPGNNWLGSNMPRYCNEAYDALAAQLATTAAIEERAEIAKAMNDMLMQEGAMIPLVHRGRVSAHANSLGGVKLNTWDSELWNVADWHRN